MHLDNITTEERFTVYKVEKLAQCLPFLPTASYNGVKLLLFLLLHYFSDIPNKSSLLSTYRTFSLLLFTFLLWNVF